MKNANNKPYSTQLSDITSRLFGNCQLKETRHASNYGVSIVEFRCIKILSKHKQLTVNQLARQMALTSSRITRIIDNLIKKQLVTRTGEQTDRRIFNLALSPKGERLSTEMIQSYTKIHEEILTNIPTEYQQPMIKILTQLNSSIEKWLEKE